MWWHLRGKIVKHGPTFSSKVYKFVTYARAGPTILGNVQQKEELMNTLERIMTPIGGENSNFIHIIANIMLKSKKELRH